MEIIKATRRFFILDYFNNTVIILSCDMKYFIKLIIDLD